MERCCFVCIRTFEAEQCAEKREVRLADVDLIFMSDEKKDADDKVFKNTVTMELTEERDENRAMDVRQYYPTHALIEVD